MQPLFVARQQTVIALALLLLGTIATTAVSSDLPDSSSWHVPAAERLGGADPFNGLTPPPRWLGTGDDMPEYNRGALPFGVDRFAFDFVDRLTREFSTQFRFPFRYAKTKPKRFWLSAAGVSALILTDHRTHNMMASRGTLEENGIIEPAARLSRWGNGSSAVPLVFGIGAIGLLANSPREIETSIMLVEALVTSAAWTEMIKILGGRERPREREELVSDWEGPDLFNSDGEGFRSFPSGHSSGIWAVATILANQYPKHKIVTILGYSTATSMSYSRMAVGAHWFSDVLVGGLIGYGCAKQVMSVHESDGALTGEAGFRFGVDVTGDYKGIVLEYDF